MTTPGADQRREGTNGERSHDALVRVVGHGSTRLDGHGAVDGASGGAGKPRPGSVEDSSASGVGDAGPLPADGAPLLLTLEQAAKTLSVGRTTIYSLLAAGVLASVQIGRCRRIPYASVRSYVDGLQTMSSPAAGPPAAARNSSHRSPKMRGRYAEPVTARTVGETIEAMRLPLAADDPAADKVEAINQEG